MPKIAKQLDAIEIRAISEPGMHPVGNSLYLQIKPTGSRSWILRTLVGGKRKEIGLGGYPAISLSNARARAVLEKENIKKGEDPIVKKRKAAKSLKSDQDKPTFAKCASQYIEMQSPSWRNAKHTAQWTYTMEQYVNPHIGTTRIDEVEESDILKVLEPIWLKIPETATRVRSRLESIIGWAMGRKYREKALNPARYKDNLDAVLPKQKSKRKRVKHFAALPFEKMGAFMADLKTRKGFSARALEFLILTNARSIEVRRATWDEIDFTNATWTIPGDKMKNGTEHKVPLSKEALALLNDLHVLAESDLLFPSVRDTQLSDMALLQMAKSIDDSTTVHGLRSTFKDWASEKTNFPNIVSEKALAHTVASATEAAYRRGDLFAKRVALMQQWSQYCNTIPESGTVTQLHKGAA